MSGYDNIIDLPHPVSSRHTPMAVRDRAAQFAPFAALTGFGEVITEAARLTQERIELDDSVKEELNERLRIVGEHLDERPEVVITYFEPDKRKSGGAYVTVTGAVKRIDETDRVIRLVDGTVISVDELYALHGELLDGGE